MKLSKAEREKLTKEAALYEQTCYFILSCGLYDVLGVAYENIYSVFHDLDVILSSSSSPVDDVSLMIDENRSKVENELIYICDNAYNIKTRQVFKEFLVHFKQGDLTKYRSKVILLYIFFNIYFFVYFFYILKCVAAANAGLLFTIC